MLWFSFTRFQIVEALLPRAPARNKNELYSLLGPCRLPGLKRCGNKNEFMGPCFSSVRWAREGGIAIAMKGYNVYESGSWFIVPNDPPHWVGYEESGDTPAKGFRIAIMRRTRRWRREPNTLSHNVDCRIWISVDYHTGSKLLLYRSVSKMANDNFVLIIERSIFRPGFETEKAPCLNYFNFKTISISKFINALQFTVYLARII